MKLRISTISFVRLSCEFRSTAEAGKPHWGMHLQHNNRFATPTRWNAGWHALFFTTQYVHAQRLKNEHWEEHSYRKNACENLNWGWVALQLMAHPLVPLPQYASQPKDHSISVFYGQFFQFSDNNSVHVLSLEVDLVFIWLLIHSSLCQRMLLKHMNTANGMRARNGRMITVLIPA